MFRKVLNIHLLKNDEMENYTRQQSLALLVIAIFIQQHCRIGCFIFLIS
jgi:hypothetical protein